MNQRQVKALQKRIHRHAKNNCINYESGGGCKLTSHGRCMLSFESGRVQGNVCPYFNKSILPSEPKLLAEYMQFFPDNYPLKPAPPKEYKHFCAKCGEGYDRKGNRQIYCTGCAAEVRQNKERLRQQRRRLGLTKK